MSFFFNLKRNFFHTFQEVFVYHHSSLNFRAKIFALVIAADDKPRIENYIVVKNYGLKIYNNDEKRATLLVLATKEYVEKVKLNNGLYLDTLIMHIQQELKKSPRYAKKIDIEALKPLLEFTIDEDTKLYQTRILDFLQNLKDETLNKEKS